MGAWSGAASRGGGRVLRVQLPQKARRQTPQCWVRIRPVTSRGTSHSLPAGAQEENRGGINALACAHPQKGSLSVGGLTIGGIPALLERPW